jgi:hypothetical protein
MPAERRDAARREYQRTTRAGSSSRRRNAASSSVERTFAWLTAHCRLARHYDVTRPYPKP